MQRWDMEETFNKNVKHNVKYNLSIVSDIRARISKGRIFTHEMLTCEQLRGLIHWELMRRKVKSDPI